MRVCFAEILFIRKRKGHVDCAHTLTFKSVEETIEETKNCLRVAAPGGGYIFSSSNSIHSAVKPENYIAMLDTLKKIRDKSDDKH